MENILQEELAKLDIIIDEVKYNQFRDYYDILIEWNKVMNLTGITEYSEVVKKHFIDSLAITNVLDMKKITSVIDIGTGAGFPGIPLKIVFPHLRLTLLDSLNKRVRFLDEVIGRLGLNGITTVHGRAEDYARQKEYRESYDLCVSRAVANLSTLSEYCIPYIRCGGIFISYKSGDVEEEMKQSEHAVTLLGGKISKLKKFQLPDTDIGRSFIIIEKNRKTDNRYPRKAGLPAKEPL